MKTYNKIFLVSGFFILIFASCRKKDMEKPMIMIHEPKLNDSITLSLDSIHLMATISDNEDLHEASVEVTINGNQVFFDTPLVHDSALVEYHKHFVPTGISTTQKATLTIIASDRHDNIDTSSVDFWIKP